MISNLLGVDHAIVSMILGLITAGMWFARRWVIARNQKRSAA
jgi:hypothetical protein